VRLPERRGKFTEPDLARSPQRPFAVTVARIGLRDNGRGLERDDGGAARTSKRTPSVRWRQATISEKLLVVGFPLGPNMWCRVFTWILVSAANLGNPTVALM
jgi:hypothetical protein